MPVLKRPGHYGFTLVELLIVVIILAVLASVAIPQFSSSTEDAKSSALDSTLSEMRNAIELYYHQHGEYPAKNKSADGTAGGVASDFLAQLSLYTDRNGKTNTTKTAVYKYGPYLKKQQLPVNPLDDKTDLLLVNTGDITATGTNAGGWWFDSTSGKFLANITGEYNR